MTRKTVALALVAVTFARLSAAQEQPVPEAKADAVAEAPPPAAPAPVTTPEPTTPATPPPDERVEAGGGLFEASQANATDAPKKPAATGEASDSFDLNGYVRSDVFVGPTSGVAGPTLKTAYGELALKLRVRKQKYGDAYAEARLRSGTENGEQQTALSLREAFVNLYLGPLDLRLGQQIIVWGRADGFNPTNNLTPFDFQTRSPVEDDRRLANAGARAFMSLAPFRLEGVWMPLYSPTRLPDGVVLPDGVSFGDPNNPEPKLKNGLGAGRLHLELPAFEASASYVFGYAPLPGIALRDFNAGRNYGIRIAQRPYKQHVFGADFSTVVADYLGVRGEAAYRIPLRWRQKVYAARPDLQYVLGVDHSFGSLSVIAQYVGRHVFDWARQREPSPPFDPSILGTLQDPLPQLAADTVTASINEVLAARNQTLFAQTVATQHLISLRLEWLALHDTLSLSALGLANFTTEEWLLYPKIGYQISDEMSTSVGAEIYQGPNGTLLGLLEKERSAAYAELRFGF